MSSHAWSSRRLIQGVRAATPAPRQTSSGLRTSGFDWTTSRFWKTSASTCGEGPRSRSSARTAPARRRSSASSSASCLTGTVEWSGPVRIGYVPQNFVVTDVPITVRDFLGFKSGAGFEESLAAVGLGSAVLPKRLDVLSGGEMQRVLIAWAVLDRPNVLLFDEPTATVDIGSEDMLYESLNRLEKETNITVFLIT